MSRFSWLRWLRSHSRPQQTTFRKRGRVRRRPELELLEDRVAPATLPTAVVSDPATIQVQTGGGGSTSLAGFSPDVAVDPLHSSWLVEVNTTGTGLIASYSENGGQTWTEIFNTDTASHLTNVIDPTTNAPFTTVTDPTVAIDRAQNVYITAIERNTTLTTSGALVFQRWYFNNGGGISAAVTNSVIQEWVGADPILNPVVAVDNNVASFTDTTASSNNVQTDTLANIIGDPTGSNPAGIDKALVVAWNTNNTTPVTLPAKGTFDPNVIMAAGSGDGGTTWTSSQIVNDTAGGTPNGNTPPIPTGGLAPNYADPQIVFTQGAADGSVTGGQLVFAWDDYANNTFLLDASQPDSGVAGNPALQAYTVSNGTTGQFLDAGVKVSAATVNSGGNNYNPGDLLTAAGGTVYPVAPPTETPGPQPGSMATFNVTTVTPPAPNAITGVSVANAGLYIIPPATPNSPTGGAGSGASLNLTLTNVPETRSYTANVALPATFTVNDLQLTLDVTDPNLADLTIELDPPGVAQGSGIILVSAGAGGMTGANLGEITTAGTTFDVGTTFDDTAPRAINDISFTGPYIGRFTAEAGAKLDIPGETTGTGVDNGTWTLRVTDTVNEGTEPTMSVDKWSLTFSHISTTGFGTDRTVAGLKAATGGIPPVTGADNEPYPLVTAASGPQGIGPGLSLAVDNTLGAFSPYEGRVYLAYTSAPPTGNPSTDTNVYLISGDGLKPNRAPTWNTPVRVNDDSVTDGFSEGTRPQFMPTVAVDQTTGTVGVMYYDGRWDSALTRVANSFSDSIDGGQTWSTSTFFNTPKTVTDAITEQSITLEPIPGNQGQVAAINGTSFGFGDRQGLVMAAGHVYPVFASNDNDAGSFILSANVTIAAGPRIIFGDQGPIVNDFTYTPDDENTTYTYNDTFAADGTQQFGGFVVQFDRPILISSFTTSQVTVEYHDTTTPAALPDVNITGFTITALDAGVPGLTLLPASSARLLATSFLIQLDTPRSAVGTYSYAIGNLTGGPVINDGIKRSSSPTVGNFMDQNQDAITGEVPDSYVGTATIDSNNLGFGYQVGDILTAVGGTFYQAAEFQVTVVDGAGEIISASIYQPGRYTVVPASPVSVTGGSGSGAAFDLNFTGSPGDVFAVPMPTDSGPFQLPYDSTTQPLIVPGPHPSLDPSLDNGTSVAFNPQWNSTSTDNTVLNGTNNGIDVTFDRDINPTTFTPANVLGIEGPLGPITTYTLGPAVTFTGGGGSGALGFATIVGGVLSGVVITNGGSGYTSLPTVVFNGGGGSGASGTAVVAGGRITGVTLTSGGIGYTGTSAGAAALAIPDTGTLSVPLTISDSLQINDLGVEISLNDTHVADLTATLTSPAGTVVELFDGGSGSSYTNTIYDDEAPDAVIAGASPYTGIFRPAQGATAVTAGGGGSGYKVNDVLVVQGGTFEIPTELQVTSVNSSGAVTGAKALRDGSYSVLPANPVSVSDATTPAASGATFSLAFSSTLADLDGQNYLGTWTLRITDNVADGSSGHLTALALNPVVITPDPQTLATATVDAGGSGYTSGDHLIVQGGTYTAPAVLLVTSVDANGAVTGVAPLGIVEPGDLGLYSVAPASPASVAGGTGSGASFDLTFNADGPLGQTFRITFPTQTLSGTYSVQLGQDSAGNYILDTSLNSATVAHGGSGYQVMDLLNVVGGTGTAAQFQVDAVGAETGPVASPDISGGSGYKVGDILTVSGGTFLRAATLQVTSIGAGGSITGATVINGGAYTIVPTDFVSVTGGNGADAFFNLSFDALAIVELVSPGSYTTDPASPAAVTDATTPAASGGALTLVFGNRVDTQYEAGVPLLVGTVQTGGSLETTAYPSGTVNTPLPPGATVDVPITVPDSYLVQGVSVTLSILHQNDPDLTATLIAPDGSSDLLFSGAGTTGSTPHANFTNTTLEDSATIPIGLASTQPGIGIGAGPYDPQQPLTTAFQGAGSLGTWILEINSDSSTLSGTLVKWTLTLQSAVNGLGEAVADQFAAPFRIFTQAPTDAVSQQSWTAVGPASINNGADSGRIGGMAIDPSDPSGNTVYVAGASGSVWKTTDFMTTNPNGPTWVPLTDVGPVNSLNTGSIAVFGRNNDPNQSIVFVATGEGSTGTPGVGLLRSEDGGRTWELLDSTDNVDASGNILGINDPNRDHKFVGTSSYKVIVDPTLSPSGQVIVYLANSSGVWRSTDTGGHWTLLQAGDASDVVLSAGSAGSTGNLQILYAAIEGAGVYFTSNAPTAASLTLRAGDSGDPIRRDVDVNPDTAIPISNDNINPLQGGSGRITLATPALTSNPLENTLYEGWCYAVVATGAGAFGGLYVTKDFGLNWTLVRLPVLNPFKANETSTNNFSIAADDSVTGSAQFPQANYNVSLAVDPNDANVVYIGGTADANPELNTLYGGFIRVDISGLQDPYAVYAYDNSLNDGGKTQYNTQGAVTLKPGGIGKSMATGYPLGPGEPYGMIDPDDPNTYIAPLAPYVNMLRDPEDPFLTPSSLQFTNIASFGNSGIGATYNSFTGAEQVAGSSGNAEDEAVQGNGLGGTDQHQLIAFKDPLTGETRLIFGDDQGIWTGSDDGTGNPIPDIGATPPVGGSRNGNLQITQFYDGATQPSTLAADVAQAEFYGVAQDDGFPTSAPDVLDTGNLDWNGPGGDGSGVKVDQTGSGTAFYYKWPCCGGSQPLATDFWTVDFPVNNEVSRTTGLIQNGDNPGYPNSGQWPYLGGSKFAVNPIDGTSIAMSALNSGNIFLTSGPSLGQGVQWFEIAKASTDTDGSYAEALAFGAPANADAPLSDYIYAGTIDGHIFVTTTGGAPWKNISNGLDGSAVEQIVTNPTRGSNEAYAVTEDGVWYMPDSSVANPTWIKITGNLFQLPRQLFNDPNQVLDPTSMLATLGSLTAIQADWRYAIPGPNGTFPVLYVAGTGGVFRSLDQGKTWTFFPDISIDGASTEGGQFPSLGEGALFGEGVTDLSLSLGNINPLNGTPDQTTGRDMLVATTYGRGTFAIRLNDQIIVPSTGQPLYTYAVNPVDGPHVASISPVLDDDGVSLDGIQVTFSGPVDPATFTLADILSVTGPTGNPIVVSAVEDITGGDPHNVYEVVFDTPQSALGFYHLSLLPNMSDYSGDKLDQNQNGINGEVPGDDFNGRFLFQPETNSAPVLNATSGRVPSINEDETAATVAGESLATFLAELNPAPGITDADSSFYAPLTPPVGIAITGVDDTNGTWQYSQNGGTTWTNIPATVADSSALLLEADAYGPNNWIRFLPTADWDGTATFTFRAWDLTSGLSQPYETDGGTADTTDNGGTSAFSTATATAIVDVNFVNDQPSFTAGNPTSPEDVATTPQLVTVPGWVTNFNPGGAPDANELGQSPLQYIVSGVSNLALFDVLPAVSTSGTLTYTLNPGINGTSLFSVQVRDNGGIQVASASVAAGGGGYDPGDVLTIQGGTSFSQAQLVVLSVGAGGAITAVTAVTVVAPGAYTVLPAGPVSVTGGSGNGATFNLTFDGIDTSTAQTFTLTVNPPNITVNPPTLPAATAGAAYSQALSGSGGFAPYSNFSVTSGALPAGLSLTPGGLLSGTPTAVGSFSFTVTTQDSSSGPAAPYTGSTSYTLTVNPPVITFTPAILPNATAGAAYSQTIGGVGGTAPYSNFTITAGTLPAGVKLSAAGLLSGTPTQVGSFSFTIQAQDSTTGPNAPYTGSQSFALTVNAPVITFTPPTLPNATAGASYTQNLTAVGGTAPYSNFTISAGALPAGLTLSPAGKISGTPTAVGNFSFTIRAQDSTTGPAAPYTGSQPYALTVNAPIITFTPSSLANDLEGAAYTVKFGGVGGTAPYSNFTISAGALPAGLTLSTGGTLSGAPTVAGSFSFTVTAQDSTTGPAAPYTGSKVYSLTVIAPFNPATLSGATAGVVYSQTFTAVSGTGPVSNFKISAGALPGGLVLSTGGILSGTPTAVGTFNFTVSASDNSPSTGPTTAAESYSLTVAPPTIQINPSTLGTAQAGVAFGVTLTGSGGTAPYSNFTVTSGALPAGLTLTAGSGLLSGTPTAVGSFSFTVTAQDSTTGPAAPYTGSQNYALTVNPPVITFTPASLTNATAGASYSQPLTGSGGTAPYSNFTITSGALPAGLTLTSAGLLSGTPTAVGNFSFTVMAQDSTTGPAAPYSGSQPYALTVNAPVITFTPSTLPNDLEGAPYSQTLSGSSGTAPYSNFTITSGALPTGLTLTSAGLLSGTPTVAGNFSFTVRAQDSTTGPAAPYTGSENYTLTVIAPFAPASLPGATAGVTYSQTFMPVSGTGPASNFTIGAGALPGGLTLSSGGVLSGTPTAVGIFSFTVSASDSSPSTGPTTASQPYTLTVAAPTIHVTPNTLGAAQAGVAYNVTLSGSGGTAPYSHFTITSGALPAGLTLTSAGLLSGTPTAVGNFSFTVTTQDSTTGPAAPYTGSQNYALTVNPPVITFTPASLANATAGASYSQTLSGVGGTAPYSNFTVTSGALPAGLILSAGGLLSGTPTAVGNFSFTIRAQDSTTGSAAPYTGSQNYALTVSPPVITFTPANLVNATAGASYSQTLSGFGGTAPYSNFTITSGAPPAGVILSAAGLLSGTPTAVGNFSFTVRAQDSTTGPAAPYTGSQNYALTVNPPVITFTPANLPNATATAAYSQPLTAVGGTAPYSHFTITSGGLPTGLTFTSAGLLSGTPTVTGNFSFTVTAQDSTTGPAVPYTGSQNYTLDVVADNTTVTVRSSAVPSAVTGQNVTFTATVKPNAPGTGIPAGTVDFLIDGVAVDLGIPLTNGQATAQTSALTAAGSPHTITFDFNDTDLLYNDGSGSLAGGQAVVPAQTSTVLSSSSAHPTFGQAITFTATVSPVAPGGGVPDGSVKFLVDGVSQGLFSLDTVTGQATFSTSSLAVGTHTIAAAYSGSPSYAVSSGTLTGGQAVAKAPSQTALSESFNPTRLNEPITFTALVSSPGISNVPTGTVTFSIDGVAKASPTLSGGVATYSPTTALTAAVHTVTALYNGSSSFLTSSGTAKQTVLLPGSTPSAVAITSSEAPAIYSDTVTLTAAVTGSAGTPTGQVTFFIDGINQGTSSLDDSGQDQLVVSNLTVGTHTVLVSYYGDNTYKAASKSIAQVVNKIPTSTALTSSFNPSRRNEPLTFTATVTSTKVAPTGTVTFSIDGAKTTVNLSGGVAIFSPAALAVGNHAVSVQYNGTATIAISSAALTQAVKAPGTAISSIAIFPSEAPSFYGDSVTFTADVTGTDGTPTGGVTFYVNGTNDGTFAVDGFGLSQFVVSTLAVGSPVIKATYWGDDTYAPVSGSIVQTVDKANTSTALTSTANPAVVLTPITFTATVTSPTVSGTPAGSVTFFIDGASQGTVNLSGGQATFVTTALAVGDHNVVAQYNGSATLAVSNGSVSQQVQEPGTSTANTTLTSSLNPSLPSQAVTFTATVTDPTNAGTPTGWVRFTIDNVLGPYVALNASGQATDTLPSLTAGTHTVYAFYYGDLTYARSQSLPLTQTVTGIPPASLSASIAKVGTTWTITVLALTATGAVDTSYSGPVSFTPVSVPPSGTIQGGSTATFTHGQAQFPGLVFTPAGKYEVEIIDSTSGLTLFFTFFIGGRQT